jgi:hypothetical protein
LENSIRKRRWTQAPFDIGKLDGAFFCDRRDDYVFVYHPVVKSYHAIGAIKAQKSDQ